VRQGKARPIKATAPFHSIGETRIGPARWGRT
jgi:hypothetical protein